MQSPLNISSEKPYDIRGLRKFRGISQAKLAQLIDVNQAKLSRWELGKEEPSDEELDHICLILQNLDSEKIAEIRKKSYRKDPSRRLNHYKPSFKILNKNFPFSNQAALESWEKYCQKIPIKLMSELDNETNGYRGISLFSGCGGFTLGFKYAKFEIVGHVENNDSSLKIYNENFPESVCLGKDIRAIQNSDILDWKSKYGIINVLFGGPPCQGFSLAGKRDKYDSRNELFYEYSRIASVLQPEVILLENVRLMTSMKSARGKMVTELISKAFDEAGYHIKYKTFIAQDFGVPQFRQRVFFIGVRKDLGYRNITFPSPSHGDINITKLYNFIDKPLEPYTTFRDATVGLESLESGESSKIDRWHFAIHHPEHVIEWLKDVPEGKSAHENSDPNKRPPSGYNTTYKRIVWDEPCSTISTNFNMISGCRNVHPSNTRSLTIREALRCQTFPDDFKLPGEKLTEIRRSIGNAVPPLLAMHLANHLYKILQEIGPNSKTC